MSNNSGNEIWSNGASYGFWFGVILTNIIWWIFI